MFKSTKYGTRGLINTTIGGAAVASAGTLAKFGHECFTLNQLIIKNNGITREEFVQKVNDEEVSLPASYLVGQVTSLLTTARQQTGIEIDMPLPSEPVEPNFPTLELILPVFILAAFGFRQLPKGLAYFSLAFHTAVNGPDSVLNEEDLEKYRTLPQPEENKSSLEL